MPRPSTPLRITGTSFLVVALVLYAAPAFLPLFLLLIFVPVLSRAWSRPDHRLLSRTSSLLALIIGLGLGYVCGWKSDTTHAGVTQAGRLLTVTIPSESFFPAPGGSEDQMVTFICGLNLLFVTSLAMLPVSFASLLLTQKNKRAAAATPR